MSFALKVPAACRERPIPACAGEPRGRARAWLRSWAYPRVRGGTGKVGRVVARGRGLSPRARGNQAVLSIPNVHAGPIPACAGEPTRPARSGSPTTAYPRVRGGTPARPPPIAFGIRAYPRVRGGTTRRRRGPAPGGGLSPRVRGNPPPLPASEDAPRPIPACAGEPAAGDGGDVYAGAYPRVRGGTLHVRAQSVGRQGLSPRARGNPDA